MLLRRSMVSVLMLFVLFVAGRLLADDPRVTRQELEEFLDIGWEKSATALPAAEKAYQELAAKTDRDPLVVYAWALIKLRHLKHAEADKVLVELLESHPRDIHAWRMRIWINVSRREFEKALNQSVKLVEALPPEGDEAAAETRRENAETLALESSRFLGRVFGFLDGPSASVTNDALRADFREQVVARLGPRRSEQFQEGRDSVIDKYLELSEQQSTSKEKAKAEKAEERERRLKELGGQKDELGKQSESLREQNDKLKAEVKERLESLERKDRPLATRFARLDAQATAIREQLQFQRGELVILQRRLDNEKDPNLRRQIFGQMDLIGFRANRVEADLAATTREAAGVAAERNELQRQANVVQERASQEVDQQGNAFEELKRKQRSTESQEKRVKKSTPSSDSTEVRIKSTRLQSFVTYEPFPLEKERQRIVDLLNESP